MTAEKMKERLEQHYQNSQIQVIDLTGTQDHYQVLIQSDDFVGKTKVQRHKDIMAIFDNELKTGEVHALTIKAVTVKEGAQNG